MKQILDTITLFLPGILKQFPGVDLLALRGKEGLLSFQGTLEIALSDDFASKRR